MGHEVTIGGERLGSGKKMKAYLHNYERSSHNLSYAWRSTMAAGTLVPFMSKVAQPGDTFDIDLNADVLTMPTVGPLFGSYKLQLDVFQIPIRLYQAKLHMNMLGIGMNMSAVALPQIAIEAWGVPDPAIPIDNQQINASCLLSYLGIRGVGHDTNGLGSILRNFNAIPLLGYWDLYKQYYANKQEEIGAMIHRSVGVAAPTMTAASVTNRDGTQSVLNPTTQDITFYPETTLTITATGITNTTVKEQFLVVIQLVTGPPQLIVPLTEMFNDITIDVAGGFVRCSNPSSDPISGGFPAPLNRTYTFSVYSTIPGAEVPFDSEPQILTFPLENIDQMRQDILSFFNSVPFEIDSTTYAPYGTILAKTGAGADVVYSKEYSQEGLALKTYNSDLFNNWIQTEWIEGVNGISEVTAIDTSSGEFTIDEFNMSMKVYKMLNRIAISDGTYDAWLDAVYTHERTRQAENPIYIGGLIRNVVFEEVISNAASENQPLGTLAGRGRMGSKNVGGEIIAKIDEPSYIMGIASLTPELDYSQGNSWDMSLDTLNDFHKPALDEIGFQDLITEQMAWWDTGVDGVSGILATKSAGKQPAWINYMTSVNEVRGNFADQNQQMFMVLNRRYNLGYDGGGLPTIADLTTYIDPTKFNNIFADTRRDSQNFWVQIGVGITARRKMSAKIMPNL